MTRSFIVRAISCGLKWKGRCCVSFQELLCSSYVLCILLWGTTYYKWCKCKYMVSFYMHQLVNIIPCVVRSFHVKCNVHWLKHKTFNLIKNREGAKCNWISMEKCEVNFPSVRNWLHFICGVTSNISYNMETSFWKYIGACPFPHWHTHSLIVLNENVHLFSFMNWKSSDNQEYPLEKYSKWIWLNYYAMRLFSCKFNKFLLDPSYYLQYESLSLFSLKL